MLNTEEAGARLGLSPRTIEGIEQGRGFSNANLLVLALLQAAKKRD
jgi:transcriptional regulator with XRE-family HTH domain